MAAVCWASKGGLRCLHNQSNIQVHHWSSLLDYKSFKNPSSSPKVLPPKDLCFLPIDGMCSLLDMHGNSILWIPALEVNLSGEDMKRFASTIAAAVETGRNEPMPSPSMHARVEVSFFGQDRNQFAVTVEADGRVSSEDYHAVLMSAMNSARDIYQFFHPTKQTHPHEREQCPRMNLTCCYLCCICTSSRDREDGQGRSAVVASSDV